MPLVQIHAIKGVFSTEQKHSLLESVTEAMVKVEGEAMRKVTWVTFNEVESGDWAIGGKCLTAGAIHELPEG